MESHLHLIGYTYDIEWINLLYWWTRYGYCMGTARKSAMRSCPLTLNDMVEYLPETKCGRSIDLGYTKTFKDRSCHTQDFSKARIIVRVTQTCMRQGKAELF